MKKDCRDPNGDFQSLITMLVVEIQNNLPAIRVGGKGHSLGILIENGFNVPEGFIITAEAFFSFLNYNGLTRKIEKLTFEIDKGNFQKKSKEIRSLISEGKIPEDLIPEIKKHLNKLNAQYVSVRSSAASEDSLKASFAGLHDTFLNIKADLDLILENTRKCWTSLFNERAVIYRLKKEIPYLEGMGVVVQEMISAEISGITFTIHPSSGKSLLVEASYGLGDMTVSGKVDPDDYEINRKTLKIVEKKIGTKNKMTILEHSGTKILRVPKELAEKQVLSDDKVKRIAQICQKVEKIFSCPQDIEWCLSNNRLWLLQSRSITGPTR